MSKPHQIQPNLTATNRKDSYIYYVREYPLYSTLLLLNEYQENEWYEECAIIRDALTEYRKEYEKQFPPGTVFPMSVKEYNGKEYKDMLKKYNLENVDPELAKEKANYIKTKLPVNGL